MKIGHKLKYETTSRIRASSSFPAAQYDAPPPLGVTAVVSQLISLCPGLSADLSLSTPVQFSSGQPLSRV